MYALRSRLVQCNPPKELETSVLEPEGSQICCSANHRADRCHRVGEKCPDDGGRVLSAKGHFATGQDQDDVILIPFTTSQERILGVATPSSTQTLSNNVFATIGPRMIGNHRQAI